MIIGYFLFYFMKSDGKHFFTNLKQHVRWNRDNFVLQKKIYRELFTFTVTSFIKVNYQYLWFQ